MKSKTAFFTIISLLFFSCSFNNIYLHPTKVPEGKRSYSIDDGNGNKTSINFDSTTFQPTFIKNDKDTMQFNYTIESFVFTSDNGNQLNGWFIKPKNQEAKKTIIHFHGNSGFIPSQYTLMISFIEKGFQLFMFDYSGFGFSEGKATRVNVLIDGISIVNYVSNRKEIANTDIILYGQSLGGHLAAAVAPIAENSIDALVVEGAFSSHDDIAAISAGFFGRLMVAEKYSGKDSIANFKKPVLVIHSKEDQTVPIELGRKLFAKANSPKEFYEITGYHIRGPLHFLEEITGKIDKMIEKE